MVSELLNKIKGFWENHKEAILLAVCVIALTIISFNLGRMSLQ